VHPARSHDGRDPQEANASATPGSGPDALPKAATGIPGLDRITRGGLPRGRTTLLSGAAGSGKTMLAMEFLARGALEYGEPGLFVAFEETAAELSANVASLGFDLPGLIAADLLRVDEVRLEPSETIGTGSYDLEGLFIRMAHAIAAVGARRVVLDTIEVLVTSLPDPVVVRAELARLFRWLKEQGVTAVVTAERGHGGLSRHGLEEFVADCVIVLDHRVERELSVRRLRIVKYRGSAHGTDEYPFLIDDDGITVNPVSEVGLDYVVSTERVSTGIPDLDAMLGGGGVFRGSSVLLSGTAGTGKTSIAASFVAAACERGERSLFFSFEESAAQIIRDLRSIGLDLQPWVDAGLLQFWTVRPTAHAVEMHLSRMQRAIAAFAPTLVAVDPITSLTSVADARGISSATSRLMDICRNRQVTAVFTSLSVGGAPLEATDAHISSVADVWLLVRNVETDGERNRALYVLKARGLAHSNQVREFRFHDHGIVLLPVHVDEDGVKIGSARVVHEARERLARLARQHEVDRTRLELELHRKRHAAAVAALEAEFAAEEVRLRSALEHSDAAATVRGEGHRFLTRVRGASAETLDVEPQ
jgi:circadian clock protein KaiC